MRYAAILIGLLLVRMADGGPVAGPPDDADPGRAHREEVIRARAKARAAYAELRRVRREAMEQAAEYTPAPPPAVPGWRDEALDEAAPPPDAADLPEPVAASSGRLIVLVVAAGVVTILGLRIAAPWLFWLPFLRLRRTPGARDRRPPPPRRAVCEGPLTITLRPRAERRLTDHGRRNSSGVR